jgi:hypothetical protein
MDSIANENTALSIGQINRMKLEKIWQEVADTKALQEEEYFKSAQLAGSEDKREKRMTYSAMNPALDIPWSVGDLCEEMKKGLDKIHARKSRVPAATDLETLLPGMTYIPYGEIPVVQEGQGVQTSQVRAILREIKEGPRQSCFANTRALATLTRIVQDFVAESCGRKVDERSFTFHKYPLRYPKGSEGIDLFRIYKGSVSIRDINDFYSRALLDFFTSWFSWCFMKYNTLKECIVSASILCFTTYVDYAGEKDDAGYGTDQAYDEAIQGTLSLFDCPKLAAVVDDVVMGSSVIFLKRVIRDRLMESKDSLLDDFAVPTPFEVIEARWWDGAYVPAIRVPFALASLREFTISFNLEEPPLGTRHCRSNRKAVELGIRYNEIVDLIHDIGAEPCNEAHIVARHGGMEAVENYGDACAASVDQAALCDCGEPSHDWGVDLALGCAVWYTVVPRYRAWPQLAELHHFSTAKYRDMIEKSQHGPFVTSRVAVLNREGTYWTPDWKATVTMEDISSYESGECEHCSLILGWVMGRCLFQDAKNRDALEQLLREHIRNYVHLSDSLALPGFWEKILEIVVGGEVENSVLEEYSKLVEIFWERLRYVLKSDSDLKVVMESMVDTWQETDKLIIKSHSLKIGNVVRRAMIGVLSIQIERTYVALYQRTVDGAIAHTLNNIEQ